MCINFSSLLIIQQLFIKAVLYGQALSQGLGVINELKTLTSGSFQPEKYLSFMQVVLVVKNPPANAGDVRDAGSISWSGTFPGGEHGNPLQYSCLENSTDREACWAIQSIGFRQTHQSNLAHNTDHVCTELHCVSWKTSMKRSSWSLHCTAEI